MIQEAIEAVECATREAEESVECAERERVDQEARAAEYTEQDTKEAGNLNTTTCISSLEAKLKECLMEEAKDTREMEVNLLRSKRSFHDAMQSMLSQT